MKTTITVSRRDNPQTWKAEYLIQNETPELRSGWEKLRRSCMDDTGMEPGLLHNGETDTFSVSITD